VIIFHSICPKCKQDHSIIMPCKPVYHISPTYEDSWTAYKNTIPIGTFHFKDEAEECIEKDKSK